MGNRWVGAVTVLAVLGVAGCARERHGEGQGSAPPEAVQVQGGVPGSPEARDPGPDARPAADAVSAFVRRIFEDSKGNLWFGTNGDGVCRYDGRSLTYYSIPEGFGGVAVRGMVEDGAGNVWFATSGGVTRYDGSSFVNYTVADGLPHDDVWSLLIDRTGTLWVGTYGGVCRRAGERFVPFAIPPSEPDPSRGVSSAELAHSIMEDSRGRIWFGTSGGAYVFDGKSFSNLSEKDGLCGNTVNCILEAGNGDLWFATHHHGVCRYDGKSFVDVSGPAGLKGAEVWDLYRDHAGNIWFPVENDGLYRYDGREFTNFGKEQGLASTAVQCTYQDREGRLWAGGYLGLFRLEGRSFVAVTRDGPWPAHGGP